MTKKKSNSLFALSQNVFFSRERGSEVEQHNFVKYDRKSNRKSDFELERFRLLLPFFLLLEVHRQKLKKTVCEPELYFIAAWRVPCKMLAYFWTMTADSKDREKISTSFIYSRVDPFGQRKNWLSKSRKIRLSKLVYDSYLTHFSEALHSKKCASEKSMISKDGRSNPFCNIKFHVRQRRLLFHD